MYKYKANGERGFVLFEILILIVIILILGLAIQKYINTDTSDTTSANSVAVENDNDADKAPGKGIDDEITITSEKDLELLPQTTPASFVKYLDEELKKDARESSECQTRYYVRLDTMSDVNIDGAVESIESNSNDGENHCYGGARVIWYLQDDKWDAMGLQGEPSCDELAKTSIYSEYLSSCWDPDIGNDGAPNPNGSINNR